MSKFQKSRSIKFNNGSFNNRISQQFNQSVIQLNKTYSIKENKEIKQQIETQIETPEQTESNETSEPQTETQIELNSITVTINSDVSFENVHKHNENFSFTNPINTTMKKDTVMNFGGKLDYLYNKKLCKNKK